MQPGDSTCWKGHWVPEATRILCTGQRDSRRPGAAMGCKSPRTPVRGRDTYNVGTIIWRTDREGPMTSEAERGVSPDMRRGETC